MSTDVSSTTSIPASTSEPRTAAATRARTTHGMYSQHVTILDEDPAEFEAQRRAYHGDWNPWGVTEEREVDNLAAAQWRLDRLTAEEDGLYEVFETSHPPFEGATYPQRMGRALCSSLMAKDPLGRSRNHYVRLSNIITKSIRNLILLQKERPKSQRRGGTERCPGATVRFDDPATAERKGESARDSAACAKMTDRGEGKPAAPTERPQHQDTKAERHQERHGGVAGERMAGGGTVS